MDTLRLIIVGVDFLSGSAAALWHAVRIAQRTGAKVRVLHVINTHVVVDLQHALSPLQKNIQTSLEEEARRQWLKFEPALPGKEAIEFVMCVGNPTQSLIDEVAAEHADLLVLGMQSEAGREGAGSVASGCVRHAMTRVLLIRPEHAEAFKRVVAGIDFSEASRSVVLAAASIAKCEQALLDIIHVFEPPWRQLHYFAPMPENSPEFQAGYRAEMTEKLRDFCRPFAADLAGLTHTFRLDENSSAGRGIIEYATDSEADLIVMATSGRDKLKEKLLGSTAERVLRLAPCSMLTVRYEE